MSMQMRIPQACGGMEGARATGASERPCASVLAVAQVLARIILAALLIAMAGIAPAAPIAYKIVAAYNSGTYIQIGRDLSKYVAPDADIDLEALSSAGSVENVRRLRYEPGVKFALVQSDVHQAYLDEASNGNLEAAALIKPLRLVMPLYNEEVYFIVRADSPMKFVHEIRNARINVGPGGSGTALTASTLYRLMFGAPMADIQRIEGTSENGLSKLVNDKSADVVVVVAGQPAKLLVDMKPEARRLIKLLKVDRSHPTNAAVLQSYFPALILMSNFPNLVAEDIPGYAVKSLLVTYDYKTESSVSHLVKFSRSLCQNFAALQANGHPKWREVRLSLPDLGRGWLYYQPMEKEMKACIGQSTGATTSSSRVCSENDRILGLCTNR